MISILLIDHGVSRFPFCRHHASAYTRKNESYVKYKRTAASYRLTGPQAILSTIVGRHICLSDTMVCSGSQPSLGPSGQVDNGWLISAIRPS